MTPTKDQHPDPVAATAGHGARNGSSQGPSDGNERLMIQLYTELRALAARHMINEPGGHTLQATALVHEAYLRLNKNPDSRWDSPGHFYAAAATAMRRILIERARRYAGPKRGGGRKRLTLEACDLTFDADPNDIIALDEALNELEAQDERTHAVVMLRFFAGMSVEETARLLDCSPRTIKREWSFARAWLHRTIHGEPDTAIIIIDDEDPEDPEG
jgi:RNA polymerase sigma factor (TIGR02999 family)